MSQDGEQGMEGAGLLLPPPLAEGDQIGIFVPSSPVKEEFRSRGYAKILDLGFVPVEVKDIFSRCDFLAKEPGQNFDDIREFFHEPSIKALWAARGGYGSNYLLPLLSDLEIDEPKIIIGSSDVSYLLWYLLDRVGMVVFYGPMAYSSLADDRANLANLLAVLTGNYSRLEIVGKVLKPGAVQGVVTGGCLSNLVSLIGSPYLPELEGRILLLEDTGERPYRLDRMFWQLHQAGVFSRLKGLLLGEFPGCFKDNLEKVNFLARVLGYLSGMDVPVVYDLPFGHGEDIHTLPLGIEVEIDTSAFPGLVITGKGVKKTQAL